MDQNNNAPSPASMDETESLSTVTYDVDLLLNEEEPENANEGWKRQLFGFPSSDSEQNANLDITDERGITEMNENWLRRFRRRGGETMIYTVGDDVSDETAIHMIEEAPITNTVVALFVQPVVAIGVRYDKEGKRGVGTTMLCKELRLVTADGLQVRKHS